MVQNGFHRGSLCKSLYITGYLVLEMKILKHISLFSFVPNNTPFEEGLALYLNKFETSSPNDAL